jgi:hypothetical protein
MASAIQIAVARADLLICAALPYAVAAWLIAAAAAAAYFLTRR